MYTSNETVEIFEHNGFTVQLVYDHDAQSPRDFDENLGTLSFWHRRNELGDKHEFKTQEELHHFLRTTATIHALVYIYEHDEIALSLEPFSCPWDSGKLGRVYTTIEKAESFFGKNFSKEDLEEKCLEAFKNEIETYEQYINGETYGYEITDEYGAEVSSCYGFYGIENVKDAAVEEASALEATDKNIIESFKHNGFTIKILQNESSGLYDYKIKGIIPSLVASSSDFPECEQAKKEAILIASKLENPSVVNEEKSKAKIRMR